MKIGSYSLEKDILIIAEIGNNHEGRFETAIALIRQAAKTGVQGVKFQTCTTEYFISPSDMERFKRFKSYEFTPAQWKSLSEEAKSLNLLFLSTPLDIPSVDLLDPLVDAFKVASSDINFYPLHAALVQKKKPVILSTGGCDLAQIKITVDALKKTCRDSKTSESFALLHCVTSYPTPPDEAHLAVLQTLRGTFDCPIGYSDHTLGIQAAVLAAGLGAQIIEKHFTLDKNFSSFRDHAISADPAEMTQLVKQVALARTLVGTGEKVIYPCEASSIPLIRRSIAAGKPLPMGHCIQSSDLIWTRPGQGMAPGQERLLLGKRLKRAKPFGAMILAEDVE